MWIPFRKKPMWSENAVNPYITNRQRLDWIIVKIKFKLMDLNDTIPAGHCRPKSWPEKCVGPINVIVSEFDTMNRDFVIITKRASWIWPVMIDPNTKLPFNYDEILKRMLHFRKLTMMNRLYQQLCNHVSPIDVDVEWAYIIGQSINEIIDFLNQRDQVIHIKFSSRNLELIWSTHHYSKSVDGKMQSRSHSTNSGYLLQWNMPTRGRARRDIPSLDLQSK
jgi:hypothetical protein